MKGITIGQYYPENSIIHKLDSRFKLVATIGFIIILFFATNFIGYFAAFLYLLSVIRLSKVPFKLMLRGIRSILFIIIFTFLLNVLLTTGENILAEFLFFTISVEGIVTAIKMALRLVMLVIGSSILTLTTSPLELTDAIEYLLKPLKKIGVPSHEIAMMMTITLRFIPTLIEELDKITKAQIARGANLDTGNIIQKVKGLIPILVPLFLSSFRRADELSIAMEARCYRGDINRTKMKQMKLQRIDFNAMFAFVLFIIIIFLTRLI